MMKTIKTIIVSALVALGSIAATSANAAPGHYYGGGHWGPHYGWGVGVGVGLGVGLALDPLVYPYGYYPYGYPYAVSAPVVVTQAAPQVYVQQSSPAPQSYTPSTQSSDWYYCRNPAGYYPYVQSCAAGWQRVPAQPPQQN